MQRDRPTQEILFPKRKMTEEPPKKRRKQNKNEQQDSDKAQNTKRAVKRVESANDPTLLPQVFQIFQFSANFSEKVLSTTGSCQRPLRPCTRIVKRPHRALT